MRELLIVGVDPGTTVGYAVLDVRGNVLKARSSKQLELNSIVEEIANLGSVLAIGTDKKKCPSLIEKAAAKTGAKIIAPPYDLAVAEKETLTQGYDTRNEHEKDALAAAMYAHKELEPLLQRIGKTLEKEGKQELFGEVTEVVVTAGRNIKDALREIEEKRKPRVQTNRFTATSEGAKAAITAKVDDRLKRAEKENDILRRYNEKLLAMVKSISGELNRLRKSSNRQLQQKKLYAGEAERERKNHLTELVAKMQGIIDGKETQMRKLLEEQHLLSAVLATGESVVKKLKTLGFEELQQKNSVLRIRENDTVLVENPDIFSEKALSHLRQKNVSIMAGRKPSAKVAELLKDSGLTVIPAEVIKGIILAEAENFAAADKEQLEEAKAKRRFNRKNVLGMIEDYKEERKLQLQEL